MTLWPPGLYCVGPPFAAKTALTHWIVDSTRPMKVCCGIWHQHLSRRSFKSCKVWVGASMDWICLASTSHRCSIGLRSGDPKEAKSTPQSRCCAPQTIPEPFLLCCMVRYPAERGHSHQGIGQNQSQQNIAQSITLPPTSMPSSHSASCAMCSPGKQHTSTRPSTWCKRKRESSDRANFFHCSVVQFWCSQAHCWRFQ